MVYPMLIPSIVFPKNWEQLAVRRKVAKNPVNRLIPSIFPRKHEHSCNISYQYTISKWFDPKHWVEYHGENELNPLPLANYTLHKLQIVCLKKKRACKCTGACEQTCYVRTRSLSFFLRRTRCVDFMYMYRCLLVT